MAGWVEQLERKAVIIEDQMMAASALVARFGSPGERAAKPYAEMLAGLYRDEMPMARIMDSSDIVLHAEGTVFLNQHPGLRAFNWLCASADKQFRTLATSVAGMMRDDIDAVRKRLDLRLTGIAHGSLYAGFCVTLPEAAMFTVKDDAPMLEHIREALRAVVRVPAHVLHERVAASMSEDIDDPALRDAAMRAAYSLAPTGKMGIHTVDVTAPGLRMGSLGLRERQVLGEALKRPVTARKQGSFVGEVRLADLDKHLFTLRGSDYTIRCITTDMNADMARDMFGRMVRVSGIYDCDSQGRPRLLQVERIEPVKTGVNETLAL